MDRAVEINQSVMNIFCFNQHLRFALKENANDKCNVAILF
jgi:hypothetical protein